MWFFIEVDNEQDIGIHENRRFEAKWTSCERTSPYGAPSLTMRFEINCIERKAALPITEETDSAPTGKSLEERVKSLENAVLDNLHDAVQTGINTRLIDVMYETQPKANKWFQDEIAKVKQEMESRTEQLSDEHNELKNAFEAECDKYDAEFENLFTSTGQWTTIGQGILDKNKREIKNIQQQLSELQQAFVKYAICKDTESPGGEKTIITTKQVEPDFVYNKSGEVIGYTIPPSGSSVQADEPKIMTIEEAERQIKHLEAHSDQLLSEPRWSLATHYIVAENVEKVCALKEWIENQKNIKPPEEPDIVEQIKAGENRLWELRKSVDCVAAIANSASETVSLKEHVIKLMSIHTGLNITGIRMCNKTYKIHYNCKEKGIYVELD